jgi:hypothetical protein
MEHQVELVVERPVEPVNNYSQNNRVVHRLSLNTKAGPKEVQFRQISLYIIGFLMSSKTYYMTVYSGKKE